jgi:phytanoyl-CoA hydroxylase
MMKQFLSNSILSTTLLRQTFRHSCRALSAEACNDLGFDVDVNYFHENGVGIVKSFASPEECQNMMSRMSELINDWDPTDLVVFRTDDEQIKNQGNSDYFLDSGDGIAFFLEPSAIDETTGVLQEGRSKHTSLNKVGHGLHVQDPLFREYSTSPRISALTRALGWKDPVLPQSMYIFKQPHDGAEVTSHQDSTFLYTEPRQTCLGLWLALEDATVDNGCIWARPGSHREPIRRHFYRNPEYFVEGNKDAPQMLFRTLVEDEKENPALGWEGALPPGVPEDEAARNAGFIPFECKQGDLVLIHGSVDHLSLKNTSSKSRHTYQLHLIEGPNEGIEWSKENWLQLTDNRNFLPL